MPLGMVVPTVNHHHIGPQEAKTAIDVRETTGLHHLTSHCLPWIMGSRATGAHYQQLPQYCPGLIGQTDPGVPEEGDGTGRTELA